MVRVRALPGLGKENDAPESKIRLLKIVVGQDLEYLILHSQTDLYAEEKSGESSQPLFPY